MFIIPSNVIEGREFVKIKLSLAHTNQIYGIWFNFIIGPYQVIASTVLNIEIR